MKPYNPLEKENLGKSVTQSMVNSTPHQLSGIQRFVGAGVYAIYYVGDFDAYLPLRKWNCDLDSLHLPIYVGKAVPTGGRKGGADPSTILKGAALFNRLVEHRKSIEEASNLEISDFWCRYLVVDDIWIPLGESLLIQHYKPLWNSSGVDGFGNHDPGKGRYLGARSPWDTLHPGRSWVKKCGPSKQTETQLRAQIRAFWATHEGPAGPGGKPQPRSEERSQ